MGERRTPNVNPSSYPAFERALPVISNCLFSTYVRLSPIIGVTLPFVLRATYLICSLRPLSFSGLSSEYRFMP
ncbi:hypothetical protein NDU88_002851 [Pleurodeles waltl]|uniref:Uncharacterized protein n=1 Tax=Pleurodeles waltl TaxID=8319 RepID=A0AAV7NF61_PLEWA|nr:hypothetical protein NDU88_002851 [Pleurodeles waltl]